VTATSPVLKQIAGLPKLSQDELKALWREYFGVKPPAYRRGFLVRGLAHRLQELTYGGLKPAYQARLDAMIAGTEKPNGAGRPGRRPRHDVHLLEGTKLLREWRGVTHEVTVPPRGCRLVERGSRGLHRSHARPAYLPLLGLDVGAQYGVHARPSILGLLRPDPPSEAGLD
jgi:hypothetical protein